jgi:hypothetical protein
MPSGTSGVHFATEGKTASASPIDLTRVKYIENGGSID